MAKIFKIVPCRYETTSSKQSSIQKFQLGFAHICEVKTPELALKNLSTYSGKISPQSPELYYTETTDEPLVPSLPPMYSEQTLLMPKVALAPITYMGQKDDTFLVASSSKSQEIFRKKLANKIKQAFNVQGNAEILTANLTQTRQIVTPHKGSESEILTDMLLATAHMTNARAKLMMNFGLKQFKHENPEQLNMFATTYNIYKYTCEVSATNNQITTDSDGIITLGKEVIEPVYLGQVVITLALPSCLEIITHGRFSYSGDPLSHTQILEELEQLNQLQSLNYLASQHIHERNVGSSELQAIILAKKIYIHNLLLYGDSVGSSQKKQIIFPVLFGHTPKNYKGKSTKKNSATNQTSNDELQCAYIFSTDMKGVTFNYKNACVNNPFNCLKEILSPKHKCRQLPNDIVLDLFLQETLQESQGLPQYPFCPTLEFAGLANLVQLDFTKFTNELIKKTAEFVEHHLNWWQFFNCDEDKTFDASSQLYEQLKSVSLQTKPTSITCAKQLHEMIAISMIKNIGKAKESSTFKTFATSSYNHAVENIAHKLTDENFILTQEEFEEDGKYITHEEYLKQQRESYVSQEQAQQYVNSQIKTFTDSSSDDSSNTQETDEETEDEKEKQVLKTHKRNKKTSKLSNYRDNYKSTKFDSHSRTPQVLYKQQPKHPVTECYTQVTPLQSHMQQASPQMLPFVPQQMMPVSQVMQPQLIHQQQALSHQLPTTQQLSHQLPIAQQPSHQYSQYSLEPANTFQQPIQQRLKHHKNHKTTNHRRIRKVHTPTANEPQDTFIDIPKRR